MLSGLSCVSSALRPAASAPHPAGRCRAAAGGGRARSGVGGVTGQQSAAVLTRKPGDARDTRNGRGRPEGRGTPRQDSGRAGGPGGGSSAPAAAARAAPTVQVVPSAQGPPRVSPGPSGVSSELSHLLSVRWQGRGLISQSDSQGKHRFPRQINERENRKL